MVRVTLIEFLAFALWVSAAFADDESLLQAHDCYNGHGVRYAGKKSTTKSGFTCQAWASQTPQKHSQGNEFFPDGSAKNASNYCRNPDDYTGGPWCYTIDGKKWESCGLEQCSADVSAVVDKTLEHVGSKLNDKVDEMTAELTVMKTELEALKEHVTNGCPAGYRKVLNTCLKIVFEEKHWWDAQKYCYQDGGRILSILSKEMNDAVGKEIYSLVGLVDDRTIWIGGTDLVAEGKWMWAANKQPVSYSNWAPGEPNNASGQHCMQYVKKDQKWDDQKCDKKLWFMCQH